MRLRATPMNQWSSLVLFFAFSVLVGQRPAQAGSFSAEVDRTEIDLGEAVTLSLTIEGKAKGKPVLPKIPDVTIEERGSQTQISSSFGGGGGFAVVQQQVMSFELMPEKAGTVNVPSLNLEVDGEILKTLPIEIKVRQARGGAAQNGTGPAAGGGAAGQGRDLVLEREVPARRTLYVGEALPVTIRVVSRVDLREKQLDQVLSPDWRVIPRGPEKALNSSRGGQSVGQWELPQIWVPGRSGALHVDPAKLVGVFLARSGGFFDMIRPVKRVAQSEPLDFQIEPLPPGEPAEFSGLVGRFTLQASLDSQKARVGDNIRLNILLEGTGMIEGWDAERELKLARGHESEFKFYSGKPKLTTLPDGEILQRKEFELALIPLKVGLIKLSPLKVTFFNPETKKYETSSVTLPPLTVDDLGGGVGPGISSSAAAVSGMGESGGGSPKADCPSVVPTVAVTDSNGLAKPSGPVLAKDGPAPRAIGFLDRLQSLFFQYGTWILMACQGLLALPLLAQWPKGLRFFGAKLGDIKAWRKRRSFRSWLLLKRRLESLPPEDALTTENREGLDRLLESTAATFNRGVLEGIDGLDQPTKAMDALRQKLEGYRFGGNSLPNREILAVLSAILLQLDGQPSGKNRERGNRKPRSPFGSGTTSLLLCGILLGHGERGLSNDDSSGGPARDWQSLADGLLLDLAERKASVSQYENLGLALSQLGQTRVAQLATVIADRLAARGPDHWRNEGAFLLTLSRYFRPETLLLVSIFSTLTVLGFLGFGSSLPATYFVRVGATLTWCLALTATFLGTMRLSHPLILGSPVGDIVDLGLLSESGSLGDIILFSVSAGDIVAKVREKQGFCQIQTNRGQTGWSSCEKFTFLPSL